MTIKEVEEKAGIRKANIRYYEEAGLITPSRDQANNYRIYSEEDVELLKKIRFLRSVDISVEDIRRLKEEEVSLGDLMDQHLEKLRREKENIQAAEEICEQLRGEDQTFRTLDPSFARADDVWKEKGGHVMKTDRIREISRLKEKDKKILDLIEVISSLFLGISIILLTQGVKWPVWLYAAMAAVMIGAHMARYRISKEIRRLRE